LTSIKLFIQTLEATLPPDDETMGDFTIIKKEFERMEDIIIGLYDCLILFAISSLPFWFMELVKAKKKIKA